MKRFTQFFFFIFYGILAIFLTFITINFIIIDHTIVLNWWLENPLNILVNVIPIFLGLLLIHSLVNRVQIPVALMTGFVLIIAYINKQKILYRAEPLFFGDFVLYKEAINIVISGSFPKKMIAIVVGIVVAMILLMFFTPFGRYHLSILKRIILFVLTLAAWFFLLENVYTEDFDKYIVQRPESDVNIAQTFNDKGIIYSLARYRQVNKVKKPDTFLKKEAGELKDYIITEEPEKKPDIIIIMGEAWTRVADWENFQFHEGMNPMEPIRELWDESFAKGNLYVPVFGGGTSNTEYDALTSHVSIYLSSTNLTAYSVIREEKDSIARVLRDLGYNTYALHPGHNWFYNRDKVYKLLGFEKSTFQEDFKNPEMKGGFISEHETYKMFRNEIKELSKEKDPYFAFLVTIQNHGPYNWYKHLEAFNRFESVRPLSEEVKSGYENYFEGIYDMNVEIRDFCADLKERKRPTVVVYFGDHHPFIGTSWQSLQEIGFDVENGDYKKMHPSFNTGFFMWGNDAFMEDVYIDREYPEFISANYLVPVMLSSFGGENVDPFLSYTYKLSQEFPILHRFFYFTPRDDVDALPYWNMSEEEDHKLNLYKSWQYMRAK